MKNDHKSTLIEAIKQSGDNPETVTCFFRTYNWSIEKEITNQNDPTKPGPTIECSLSELPEDLNYGVGELIMAFGDNFIYHWENVEETSCFLRILVAHPRNPETFRHKKQSMPVKIGWL